MNKEKMVYSNDLTKVIETVAEIESESFRKRFVLETKSGYYYTYKGKAKGSYANAIAELRAEGYTGNVHLIETEGYCYDTFVVKFLAEENKNWLDIIVFRTSCGVKSQNLFSCDTVFRFYKNNKFKMYFRDGCQWEVRETRWRPTENVETLDDSKRYLKNSTAVSRWLGLDYNDIDANTIKSMKAQYRDNRSFSDETKSVIRSVFPKTTDDQIKSWIRFREFLRHPKMNGNSVSKTAQTRKTLVDEVFLPTIEKITLPRKVLDPDEVAQAHKEGFINYDRGYGEYIRYEKCFHRIGEWIIFSKDKNQRFFYNVETDKKYCVNYYPASQWREECNIGVFRTDDLISALDNFRDYFRYYDTLSFYPVDWDGKYSYSLPVRNINYKDSKYDRAPKCYNENTGEISPEECFRGTIVVDFLKEEKDWIFEDRKTRGGTTYSLGTFEDLAKLNRCPGIAFLLLCIKKERRKFAEQLYKLKLNGFLVKMLTDPNSFKEKSEKDNYRTFLSYDKKENNLKKGFGIPMDKIRIYDQFIQENCLKKRSDSVPPSLEYLRNILGENLFTIDNETFKGYIKYITNYNGSYMQDYIKHIMEIFPNKSPKEMLKTLEKIGSPYVYSDYLRLREQYLNCFDGERRAAMEKIYKKVPDKSKKFKYLNEYFSTTRVWNEERTIVTTEEQFKRLLEDYKSCVAVRNENGIITGAYLELTEEKTIRFLHDELSVFITAHQQEVEAEGFKESAKRLLAYEYEGKYLSIVAPKESKELAIEGGTLNHCVAGFINSVIKGSENILFIRRNDMKDSPYYTIAVDPNGRIEQVHGYGNNDLSEAEQNEAYYKSGLNVYNKTFDLLKFLHEWAKAKKDLIVENTIHERYGMFGAH